MTGVCVCCIEPPPLPWAGPCSAMGVVLNPPPPPSLVSLTIPWTGVCTYTDFTQMDGKIFLTSVMQMYLVSTGRVLGPARHMSGE